MPKTTFSKHRLINISMTCVYITPEVKKDIAELTTATNEAWTG